MEVPSSLQEYIEQQDRLEREARELFPYDFSKCSWSLGPLKQQVFSCKTCEPIDEAAGRNSTTADARPESGRQRGGLCYSCSISCHGDHELVELFNKRDFRCDCGTSRCGERPCALAESNEFVDGEGSSGRARLDMPKGRRPLNIRNKYNHNFEGSFCWCRRPYDASTETGTMYQCLACEDWFHEACIADGEVDSDGSRMPMPEESCFDEYVCRDCVKARPWLACYLAEPRISAVITKQGTKRALEPEKTADVPADRSGGDDARAAKRVKPDPGPALAADVTADIGKSATTGLASTADAAVNTSISDSSGCKWFALEPIDVSNGCRSLFLREDFRQHVCACANCLRDRIGNERFFVEEETVWDPPEDSSVAGEDVTDAGAATSGVGGLIDSSAEAASQTTAPSTAGSGTSGGSGGAASRALERTLAQMPRDKAIEGVLAFNKLRDHLQACLRPLADRGEIVTADHVRQFFEDARRST